MNPQLPPLAQPGPAVPTPFRIHGHSARIGLKIGISVCGFQIPSDAEVDQILRAKKPGHITVDEFALETLMTAAQGRAERRRSIAISILVPMIQRSMTEGPLSAKDMEKMVELAWSGARVFEEQDNATATLDSLTSSAPGG
jgi:hypothetical protein